MSGGHIELLARRRFLPLFITQFLGALNDNLFKNALIILVTYRLGAEKGVNTEMMATLAAGLFILPFFLFSASAGRLADKFEKQRLIAIIKTAEIGIMSLAAVAFEAGNLTLLMTVLFLMGTHSTFFGPLKYGILPQHLAPGELLSGNALIEAGTFLAILIGTIAGGVLILTANGILSVVLLEIAIAALGLVSSLFIPRALAAAPELELGLNFVAHGWEMLREAKGQRVIWLAILGISWFWLVGATFLAQFPAFAKETLGAGNGTVTLMLVAFSVGIGIGSMLCNKLLKGEISARYVPLGALGISLFAFDLYLASAGAHGTPGELADLAGFLGRFSSWRILVDLLLIAISGGFYIVPLNTVLQDRSEESHRSRVIAANNIVNALFMVLGAIGAAAMLAFHLRVPQIFLAIGLANLLVALYICRLLPDAVIKAAVAWLLRLAYGARVQGLEHWPGRQERLVIVANHVSFLDAVLLGALLPGRPTFAVNTVVATRWWAKLGLSLVDSFALEPTNPLAAKSLIRAVQAGRQCVIFPEGRITVTGALMKIYEGPGMIADKAKARILPVRIDGAQYTPFSRLRGKLRLRLFPRITITIQPPERLAVDPALRGRPRRQALGLALYDLMTRLVFETCDWRKTLFESLLEARRIHGGGRPIVEDIRRQILGYDRLIAGSLALGRRLTARSSPGERVGLLLPNATATAVAFFALQAFGRVPALLNFSAGFAGMSAACRAADLKLVVTSRQFLEAARLDEAAAKLSRQTRLLYLEDLRREIGPLRKASALLAGFTLRFRRPRQPSSSTPAVVLFTSGSEGLPKGVALSHENLLANRYQMGALIDFNPTDIVFNALPVFHAFGLTGGLLLPLLSGVKTFLYPSPLHYRIVPQLAYDTNATILFGTDTFLAGYARAAHGYDFYSVRYVFAGAERVREETRRAFADRFGLRILEGYGATETAPVIAVNTPMQYRAGTVGRFVPGIVTRLEPVPGVSEGARLLLSGPNVMLGYLTADRRGEIQAPPGGVYDTGDLVAIDAQGFVTLRGRVKRFAKIGGEMVSLAAVEEAALGLWPGHRHAAVALPDARKGEQLALVTDNPGASREALQAYARDKGLPELFLPRLLLPVERLPLLGSGKFDYPAIMELARRAQV